MTSMLSSMSQHLSSNARRKTNDKIEHEAEQSAVPDSTTVEKERIEFSTGQDVLHKHKDGCYYLGTVVAVDSIRDQCLLQFGDNTQSWASIKNLQKTKPKQEDLLLCVVCKKSSPKDSHEIVVCDTCSRGYHKHCHSPIIPNDCQKDGNVWMCKRCWKLEPLRHKKNAEIKNVKKELVRKNYQSSTNSNSSVATALRSFPYNNDALSWDEYHRVNIEKIYCYCGSHGEWYTQMLQCSRCKQWFHEKCVSCLRYPLYCGDRFYIFVCSICNDGVEFLRRLELCWVELVHLMLFNLTAYNVLKYYELDSVIIPYINDNWHALQLPPKIYNIATYDRRKHIISVLTNNRNRFKCGREIKKRTSIWGLRVRLPPPGPCIHIPLTGPMNDEQLKQICSTYRKIHFLPLEKTESSSSTNNMVVPVDNHMLNIMMGTAYLENVQSESESPSSSPEADREKFSGNCKYDVYKSDFRGPGCVKKSVPFPKRGLQHKKRILNLKNRERDKSTKKQKNRKIIATNKKVAETRGAKRTSLDSKTIKTTDTALPLTPPTSVSAPPTPPASSTSMSGTDLGMDFCETSTAFSQTGNEKIKLTKSNLTKNNLTSRLEVNSVELNTPCDTSGDETSSKSTLDQIIPPPKDFKGKNNPFLTLLRGNDSNKKRRTKSITLPLPLTAVIPGNPLIRQTKRQLSEKDICIGPNGEVKRRRLRRGRPAHVCLPTASKTATVVPARPDATEWNQRTMRSSLSLTPPSNNSQIGNCVDYALNGRRLRQRQEKTQEKEKIVSNPPTPKHSPVKQEPEIDMDDLKSSVNSYFGAANRIAVGEKFAVRAKRVSSSGKLQYLIEWQGANPGMT